MSEKKIFQNFPERNIFSDFFLTEKIELSYIISHLQIPMNCELFKRFTVFGSIIKDYFCSTYCGNLFTELLKKYKHLFKPIPRINKLSNSFHKAIANSLIRQKSMILVSQRTSLFNCPSLKSCSSNVKTNDDFMQRIYSITFSFREQYHPFEFQ